MRTLLRTIVPAAAVATLFLASICDAKIPDPSKCIAPSWIRIVGSIDGGATPDPYGRGTIEIRNLFNMPEPCNVRLDFSACCDVRVCGAWFNGVWIDAVGGVISGFTDSRAHLEFVVLGAAVEGAGCGLECSSPGGWNGCVRIDASAGTGWVTIRRPAAVALDQDGGGMPSASGVGGSDVACTIHTVGAALLMPDAYRTSSDLSQDGVLSGVDVSAMLAQFGRLSLAGGMGCTSYTRGAACP